MTTQPTTTKEALEPCPLCPDGGKPYFTKSVNGSKMLYVGCSQCGLQLKAMLVMVTPVDEAPTKDIVAIWNTRARVSAPIVAPEVNFGAWTSIDTWLLDNPTATAAECLAELVKRIKVEAAPASTVAPVRCVHGVPEGLNCAICGPIRNDDPLAPASPVALGDEAEVYVDYERDPVTGEVFTVNKPYTSPAKAAAEEMTGKAKRLRATASPMDQHQRSLASVYEECAAITERIWMSSTCSGWSTERESIHDIEYARVHAPTGKVSEGDRELIEAVAMPWICVEEKPCGETTAVHWEELFTALTAALATVRREEREAARDRTVKTLIGLRENFIPVNRALEIVVNAAALTANDDE